MVLCFFRVLRLWTIVNSGCNMLKNVSFSQTEWDFRFPTKYLTWRLQRSTNGKVSSESLGSHFNPSKVRDKKRWKWDLFGSFSNYTRCLISGHTLVPKLILIRDAMRCYIMTSKPLPIWVDWCVTLKAWSPPLFCQKYIFAQDLVKLLAHPWKEAVMSIFRVLRSSLALICSGFR